jgi:hypothetical protein
MEMVRNPGGHGARLCGARLHQGDGTGRCRKTAGWGTDHVGEGPCRLHGGSTPTVAAGSRMRLAERKARTAMETYGRKIETTAVEALLDEVQWTAGHVAWLRERVAELEEHDLTWGTTQIKTGGADGGITEAAEPHVLLKLYQAERSHLVKVCAEAIRCGIEERRVRIAEQHGEALVALIEAILAALHLSAEQLALVPEVVPRLLRAAAA